MLKVETITTTDENGEELILDVCRPSGRQIQKGEMIRGAAWKEAVDNGLELQDNLNHVLEKRGWTQEKENEFQELRSKINQSRQRLSKGGGSFREACDTAMGLIDAKEKLVTIFAERNRLEQNTAEAYAENNRFNYLVSACVLKHGSINPYFANYEDYLERMGEKAAMDGARKLAEMLFPGQVSEKDDTEVQFLKKYKLMDNQGRLINKQGRLVRSDGKLINDKGELVDEEGNRVDFDGNRLDDDGYILVENPEPFLDDDGNPVVVPEE